MISIPRLRPKTMFIGHPLVHELPDKIDSERTVLALFPGSRRQKLIIYYH